MPSEPHYATQCGQHTYDSDFYPSVFVGPAEARGAFTQIHISLLWTNPQYQQPDIWQQTVHSAGEWTGQTGQTVTLVQKPSQVQAGSRDAALLDSPGDTSQLDLYKLDLSGVFLFFFFCLFFLTWTV